MTRKPETGSIFDIYSKFGQDLKLPQVDVESILSHHRKNLEALEKSAKATAAGASTLMNKQRQLLQDALHDVTEMAKSFRAPGTPQEMMAKQADFAKKSFEACVRNAGEVADVMKQSGTESIEILRARIRDAMEEIREGYEKKK